VKCSEQAEGKFGGQLFLPHECTAPTPYPRETLVPLFPNMAVTPAFPSATSSKISKSNWQCIRACERTNTTTTTSST
jgi:hypothetical protein